MTTTMAKRLHVLVLLVKVWVASRTAVLQRPFNTACSQKVCCFAVVMQYCEMLRLGLFKPHPTTYIHSCMEATVIAPAMKTSVEVTSGNRDHL